MTSDGRALTALHLFLVWALTAAAVPVLGFVLFASAWKGGAGAMGPVLALGVPLTVVALTVAALPARTVVPLCESPWRRLGWAVAVFGLGTLGVVAGLVAYGADVDLGSAGTRIALVGVPYAVAAAFFVPSRWVRLGAVAVLAAGVAYGSLIGPAHAQQRRHEADFTRYREHAELQYLGTPPPDMELSRAEIGPAYFSVAYRPVRQDERASLDLVVRPPLTPTLQCPAVLPKGTTCKVTAPDNLRTLTTFPGGHTTTLTRRHKNAEIEVSSQTLDEAGLRSFLDSLHPLSDEEFETLMREKEIDYRL
ncbi:hypothetical protein [Streptomyces sp. LaPpAH-108]|uniref:hypothetical protein n=1 Tax=Streptomyces sp. LaPpAH-108 TaxID=1155714 RepID=UPI00037B0EBA|nr:hypothetical protein [Streptomyces sp. LaPpAH-108]